MSPKLIHTFSNAQKDKNIEFEAHYWGRFELLPLHSFVSAIGQDKNDLDKIPIAKKIRDEKTLMYYHPDSNSYSIPKLFGFPIGFDEREFWDLEKGGADSSPKRLYFDKRRSFSDLLGTESYLTTTINDPEHFDEVEAYFELIKQFEKLSNQELAFDWVSGTEIGEHEKEVELLKGGKKWKVLLDRELFDSQIIESLNQILLEFGIKEYVFSFTIDENMCMVLLKLNANEIELLRRTGILLV